MERLPDRPPDAAAVSAGGSSPESWTASGSSAATISASRSAPASAVIATISGRRAGRGATARPGDAAQLDGLLERELARRARHEVQPDRVGAGPDRGEHAVGVGDAADLHERPVAAALAGSVGLAARRDERARRPPPGRASARAPRRRARRRTRRPARRRPSRRRGRRTRRRRAGRPGRSARSRTARSVSTSSVRRSRLLMPISRALGRERPLQLALVVGLDERLQPDLERPVDERGEPLRRMEDREQQHQVGAGGAEVRQLDRLDDELLGEDRDATRPPGPRAGRRPSRRTSAARTGREIAAAPPAS